MTISRLKKGFTFVEISIVIVIIAFIMAGYSFSRDLIKQANYRAVINEINTYKVAIRNFYMQYKALPGDMINATQFWYNATTCPGTTGVAGSCNGDGNGYILENPSSASSDEALRAWQHLSFAGLITGYYTGIHIVAGQNDIGSNVPASKYSPNGWFFFAYEFYTDRLLKASIDIGSFYAGSFNQGWGSIMPIDAYSIDIKIDDGMAKTGKVKGSWSDDAGGNPGMGFTAANRCVIGTSGLYDLLSTTSVGCNLQAILYGD